MVYDLCYSRHQKASTLYEKNKNQWTNYLWPFFVESPVPRKCAFFQRFDIMAHIVFFLLLREPRSLQVDQSLSQCTDSGQESLRAVDQSKSASQRPVRPLEQLGQPFDSSSPITSRGVRQESPLSRCEKFITSRGVRQEWFPLSFFDSSSPVTSRGEKKWFFLGLDSSLYQEG